MTFVLKFSGAVTNYVTPSNNNISQNSVSRRTSQYGSAAEWVLSVTLVVLLCVLAADD